MLVLVDHFTRFLWTFSLSQKGQAAAVIQEWLPYAERSMEAQLKVFRSDKGGEFTARELQQFFKSLGIRFETSVPGYPQQNGIPERMNRTLKEMLTAALSHMQLDPQWWTLALPWLTWVRNILPASPLHSTESPYIKATGHKPNLSLLKEFGCMCQYLDPDRQKLHSKTKWGVHVGFADNMKGWKLLDVATEQFVTVRDCYFHEHLSYKQWVAQRQAAADMCPQQLCVWPATSPDNLSPVPVSTPPDFAPDSTPLAPTLSFLTSPIGASAPPSSLSPPDDLSPSSSLPANLFSDALSSIPPSPAAPSESPC